MRDNLDAGGGGAIKGKLEVVMDDGRPDFEDFAAPNLLKQS